MKQAVNLVQLIIPQNSSLDRLVKLVETFYETDNEDEQQNAEYQQFMSVMLQATKLLRDQSNQIDLDTLLQYYNTLLRIKKYLDDLNIQELKQQLLFTSAYQHNYIYDKQQYIMFTNDIVQEIQNSQLNIAVCLFNKNFTGKYDQIYQSTMNEYQQYSCNIDVIYKQLQLQCGLNQQLWLLKQNTQFQFLGLQIKLIYYEFVLKVMINSALNGKHGGKKTQQQCMNIINTNLKLINALIINIKEFAITNKTSMDQWIQYYQNQEIPYYECLACFVSLWLFRTGVKISFIQQRIIQQFENINQIPKKLKFIMDIQDMPSIDLSTHSSTLTASQATNISDMLELIIKESRSIGQDEAQNSMNTRGTLQVKVYSRGTKDFSARFKQEALNHSQRLQQQCEKGIKSVYSIMNEIIQVCSTKFLDIEILHKLVEARKNDENIIIQLSINQANVHSFQNYIKLLQDIYNYITDYVKLDAENKQKYGAFWDNDVFMGQFKGFLETVCKEAASLQTQTILNKLKHIMEYRSEDYQAIYLLLDQYQNVKVQFEVDQQEKQEQLKQYIEQEVQIGIHDWVQEIAKGIQQLQTYDEIIRFVTQELKLSKGQSFDQQLNAYFQIKNRELETKLDVVRRELGTVLTDVKNNFMLESQIMSLTRCTDQTDFETKLGRLQLLIDESSQFQEQLVYYQQRCQELLEESQRIGMEYNVKSQKLIAQIQQAQNDSNVRLPQIE